MTDKQISTYNLKVVLKQTGLKADTLRAWERRYGLPKPVRSAGRHRLYSQRDIDTIKWLMARQGEGMSISNAVELWQNLETEGNEPLLMAEFSMPPDVSVPMPVTGGRGLDDLRALWVAACKSFDENASARILSEAFALYAVEDVCLRVILDGMRQVGEGWYKGDVAVEQEHFASAMAQRQLEALVSAAPAPTRSERIIIGAAPGELHDLALLMITSLLRRRGWDIVYLGANVPLKSYKTVLDPSRFDLAILSAEQLFTAASLREVALHANRVNLPLLYGGRIFRQIPELQNHIPANYLGGQMESIPTTVAEILASSFSPPPPVPQNDLYLDALEEFERQSPQIELDINQRLSGQLPPGSLEIANFNFSRVIQAALTLGDLKYVSHELDWIRGLMENRGVPAVALESYLEAYSQAAEQHLDDSGRLVIDWLQRFNHND